MGFSDSESNTSPFMTSNFSCLCNKIRKVIIIAQKRNRSYAVQIKKWEPFALNYFRIPSPSREYKALCVRDFLFISNQMNQFSTLIWTIKEANKYYSYDINNTCKGLFKNFYTLKNNNNFVKGN